MRSLVFALFLAGCATAPPVVPVQQACLPMVTYTLTQQQAAAAALAALPPTNPLIAFVTDYGAMRAANRACLGALKGPAK